MYVRAYFTVGLCKDNNIVEVCDIMVIADKYNKEHYDTVEP